MWNNYIDPGQTGGGQGSYNQRWPQDTQENVWSSAYRDLEPQDALESFKWLGDVPTGYDTPNFTNVGQMITGWGAAPEEKRRLSGQMSGAMTGALTNDWGVVLFKNPALRKLIGESVSNVAGPKAGKEYASFLADVPEQDSPALSALLRLYDTLGTTWDPKKQSKFGVEIEGAGQVPFNRIPGLSKKFENTGDPTVKTYGRYGNTFEGVYPPIHGWGGAAQFAEDAKPLIQDYGGQPITMSGPEFGSGAHTNVSWENMSPNEIRKLVEIFMTKYEPTVYPGVPKIGGGRDINQWTKPMPQFIKDLDRSGRAQDVYSKMFWDPLVSHEDIGQAAQSLDKYYSMNLRGLGINDPARQRIEFRYPHGTTDPEEWIKNFITTEAMVQEAKATKGKDWFPEKLPDFLKQYEDFLQENKGEIQRNRPQFGYDTSKDRWLNGMMEPGFLTKGNRPSNLSEVDLRDIPLDRRDYRDDTFELPDRDRANRYSRAYERLMRDFDRPPSYGVNPIGHGQFWSSMRSDYPRQERAINNVTEVLERIAPDDFTFPW